MSKMFDFSGTANPFSDKRLTSTGAASTTESGSGAPSTIRRLTLQVPSRSPTFPFDGSHLVAGEKYRMVRTKLMQHVKRPRILAVASAGPRDGKTTTAINLAAVSALRGEARILLIDGDIRRPSVAAQLGLPEGPGLANVLAGECQLEDAIIQADQVPSLHILVAGESRTNPSELLASGAWAAVVGQCAKLYDFIFIDTPPMTVVADYELIQATCDGIIMVIRQDQTKRKACFEALKHLPKDKLIGVLINSTRSWPLDREDDSYAYYGKYTKPPTVRAS